MDIIPSGFHFALLMTRQDSALEVAVVEDRLERERAVQSQSAGLSAPAQANRVLVA